MDSQWFKSGSPRGWQGYVEVIPSTPTSAPTEDYIHHGYWPKRSMGKSRVGKDDLARYIAQGVWVRVPSPLGPAVDEGL